MHTLIGDLDPATLSKEIETEKVPCGFSRTTRFFKEGKLVRQDCEILVSGIPPMIERFEPEQKQTKRSVWQRLWTALRINLN